MLQWKGTASLLFPKEKTIGWLSWLAGKMREHSQSVFIVEGLQPSWLGTRAERAACRAVVTLSLGLIGGLVVGWMPALSGRLIGLIVALIIFVGVGLGCWSGSPLKNGFISGSIGGLITLIGGALSGQRIIGALTFGLIVGLIGGLGTGSLNHITLVETISWKWNQFWKRTIPGSLIGLIFGVGSSEPP
jgi:hypothetical protein